MQIFFGVIADDLTGGLMVAALLEREGVSCPLLTSPDMVSSVSDHEAVVIARRTRHISAREAVADFDHAASALLDAGVRQIYFKYCATFDSNEDGNIGPCADLLMRKVGADFTGFCTAFPDWGVKVYQGYLFLRGQLVSESNKRFDPVTPMLDPNLVRVLQAQTEIKVGLISHDVLTVGLQECKRHMESLYCDGVRYFIMDAIDNSDVMRCAELTKDWPVMTGGDAIPIFLSRLLRRGGRISFSSHLVSPLEHVAGPGAVLAGSCGEATLEQLNFFEKRHPVLRIDLLKAVEDDSVVERSIDWADSRLGHGPVAISTSADPDSVAKVQQVLGRDSAAQLAEDIIGKIAVGLFDLGVRRFVVAGGETSGAVVNALGVRRIRVAPYDVPGEGYCIALDPQPISMLLKPGKAGSVDLFERGFEKMKSGKKHP